MLSDFFNIKNYKVYQYQFLDDLSFIKTPKELAKNFDFYDEEHTIDDYILEVSKLFKNNGWEGDGKIGVIWIPPFTNSELEDTFGTYVWHVKQNNNGTSFIASPHNLNFKPLLEQNDSFDYENYLYINIVQNDVWNFTERLWTDKKDFLSNYPEQEFLSKKLLYFTQNEIIGALSTFLDDCYLDILVEVLQNGNKSKLRLKKASTKIDLSKFNLHEEGLDEDGGEWLTLQMLISDIWKSYMMEPYESKLETLFRSIDFSLTQNEKAFLNKHILIRNCIQHHDCRLDGNLIKKLGKDYIKIKSVPSDLKIKKWAEIVLTKAELLELFDFMDNIATKFNEHADKRILSRNWISKDKKFIIKDH